MVSCHADSSDGCHPGRKMRVWERELYVHFQDIPFVFPSGRRGSEESAVYCLN